MKLLVVSVMCLVAWGQAAQAAPSCKSSDLKFHWGLAGSDGISWVINNYVDLDTGTGTKDYKGNKGMAAKTYNGHTGTDIDVSSLRQMDAGVPVIAAADGVVTEIENDLYDRNMEAPAGCGPWNHVFVKHANGYTSWYGHLRQFSTKVTKGDKVVVGQVLGLVGSSGCSSTAHLHFEVRDCANKVVDPFLEGMFLTPPTYDTAFHVMDIIVRKGEFPDPAKFHPTDALIKDGQFNSQTFAAGSRIGVGLSVAGGDKGDRIDVKIVRPGKTVLNTFTQIYTGPSRHSWPRWWMNLPTNMEAGAWAVEVFANNKLAKKWNFRVATTTDGVVHGVAEDTYQHSYQSFTGDTYRPVFVDGSVAPNSGARMSAIFRRDGLRGVGVHNLSAAAYQVEFKKNTALGLQPLSVDSYVSNSQVKMAAVFGTPTGGKWDAYHLLTKADHEKRFLALSGQGFRPYAISVVISNGQELFTAAYTNLPSSGWAAHAGLDAKNYQNEMDREMVAGLAPIYVKTYVDNTGVPRFSAIWTREAFAKPYNARHGLDATEFFTYNEARMKEGLLARSVSSYVEKGTGRRLFAGVWTAQ